MKSILLCCFIAIKNVYSLLRKVAHDNGFAKFTSHGKAIEA